MTSALTTTTYFANFAGNTEGAKCAIFIAQSDRQLGMERETEEEEKEGKP